MAKVTATISLEGLAAKLARTAHALVDFMTRDAIGSYFTELGTVFPIELLPSDPNGSNAVTDAVDAVRGTLIDLESNLANFDADDASGDGEAITVLTITIVAKIAEFVSGVGDLADALRAAAPGLPNMTQAQVGAFADELPRLAFEHIVCKTFEARFPELGRIASLFGLYERQEVPATDGDITSIEHVSRKLRFDRIKDLLSNPLDVFGQLYKWGQPDFDGVALFAAIRDYFVRAGFEASVQPDGSNELITEFVALSVADDGAGPYLRTTFPVAIPANLNESTTLGPNLTLTLTTAGTVTSGAVVKVKPPLSISLESSGGAVSFDIELAVALTPPAPETAFNVIGQAASSVLQVGRIEFTIGSSLAWNGTAAVGEPFAKMALKSGKVVIDFSKGDGFLKSLSSSGHVEADFELAATYRLSSGLKFDAGATFEIDVPLHATFGPVAINDLVIRLPFGAPGRATFPIDFATGLGVSFGPFAMVVDGVGLKLDLDFGSGNLGILDLKPGFKMPTGLGVSIDGGAVSGGGFISRDEVTGRYTGAIELRVFSVSVKAFGVLDTKFPDGTEGVSFVVVIIAEFTPIQLGFGFTLLGVGGLVGLNRTVAQDALGEAVRTGSLEHLLFPENVVGNAPTIIHDLATAFPAAKNHYIFGPMAKLGWGTPTIISADLGVIIELPGPRLALVGVLRMLLPNPDEAILRLQIAVAGLLDFPAKKISIDASLYDSTIAGYTVTADMAYRMEFGSKPSFLLSVGGFNPGFQPPAPFPSLRRASIDLGISGNPSLVASGYFALTSNTAQIGASIKLHASGYGINVDGWLGFDVMFVFSPFSFTASIAAGVRVSFHGVGFGINLRGSLSGPSPWHLKGKVCVSVLWWDACLPIDITFGDAQPASLPEIDPWEGNQAASILGLQAAIADPRNWSGSSTTAELPVVTLAAAATAERTPIDPLGAATLRQKVVPLNRKLEKFGEYKPKTHDTFSLGPGVGTVTVDQTTVTEIAVVEDDFVPGHFMNLTNDQKLSLPSYEPMDAGISVAADRIGVGSSAGQTTQYVTKFIDDSGQVHDNQPLHTLTQAQLVGLLKRSATALNGVRRSGTEKYMLPTHPKKIRLGPRKYVVAEACSLVRNSAITGTEVSQSQALLALREHLRTNPQDQGAFAVIPTYAERAA